MGLLYTSVSHSTSVWFVIDLRWHARRFYFFYHSWIWWLLFFEHSWLLVDEIAHSIGDFSPKTPAGRSIFVVWALLGVGTMTILISSTFLHLLTMKLLLKRHSSRRGIFNKIQKHHQVGSRSSGRAAFQRSDSQRLLFGLPDGCKYCY